MKGRKYEMKQSKEVLGMPIISIMDGKEIGKVKNIVINPEQRGIDFLVVQNDQWEFGIKAIPFKLVEGLGDYAVTIETENAVIDLADIPIANELLSKNIQIKGARVITRKGHYLGQATEYYFNKTTGKIVGCFVELPSGEANIIPEKAILTFGKDILVVVEEADKQLYSEIEFRKTMDSSDTKDHDMQEELFEQLLPQASAALEDPNPAVDFLQLTHVVGKTLSSDLYDLQGELLLEEGETITEEIVEKVKKMGRNKVMELTLKLEDE
jgi:uncharacterized protein YrrD